MPGAQPVVAGPARRAAVAEVDADAEPEPQPADEVVAGDALRRPAQQRSGGASRPARFASIRPASCRIARLPLTEHGDRAERAGAALDASGRPGEDLEPVAEVGQPACGHEPPGRVLEERPGQRRPRPSPAVADEQQAVRAVGGLPQRLGRAGLDDAHVARALVLPHERPQRPEGGPRSGEHPGHAARTSAMYGS